MSVLEMEIIDKLQEEDKEKLEYFLKIIIEQSKYQHLSDEIKIRRNEIKKNEILTHNEIWDQLNV